MKCRIQKLFTKKFALPFSATCVLLGVSAPSFAETKPAAKAPAKAAVAAPATPAPEKLPEAVNFKADDIWNVDIFKQEDHKVLVIQDRRYTKTKKIELGVHGGITKASAFYNTMSYGVHGGYHFNEYYGIDAFFNASTSSLTADATQINDFLTKAAFSSVKEYQKPISFGGVAMMWSPIYGKFAFFRKSIIHFDIFGTAGVSVMKSETNHPLGRNQTHVGSLLGVGMRVFLSKYWALRLETRQNLFHSYFAASGPASNPGNGETLLRQSFQFTLGTSVTFGGGGQD